MVEQPHRLFVQQPAGIGQAHRPGAAFDQGDAQFLLQLLDLAAQRRLGDVEPLRRAREVLLVRHGDEVAQVP